MVTGIADVRVGFAGLGVVDRISDYLFFALDAESQVHRLNFSSDFLTKDGILFPLLKLSHGFLRFLIIYNYTDQVVKTVEMGILATGPVQNPGWTPWL